MALDGNIATKYLNFGGIGSGFIVTPLVPIPVESFRITTANDALGRDPSSWALYGRNGALTTVDSGPDPAINATGMAETWTLIAQGAVALPDARQTLGPVVDVNNVGAVGYQHLKMIFPTVKTAGSIMQIADIQFYANNAASAGQEILSATDAIIAVDEILAPAVPAGWKACAAAPNNTDCSSSPGAEQAPNAIDAAPSTKYLNFGELGSGLIITNSSGQVDVNFMKLRTANDAPERDPTSYELYGTNQAIQSVAHSTGNLGETWTLISSGPLSPPMARFTDYPVVAVNSPANYQHYKLIFPTVRTEGTANSMQIADVQFSTLASQIPEPTTVMLVALGLSCVAAARRRMG